MEVYQETQSKIEGNPKGLYSKQHNIIKKHNAREKVGQKCYILNSITLPRITM